MRQPTLMEFLEALRKKFTEELQAKPAWNRAEVRLAFERSASYVLAKLIDDEKSVGDEKPWNTPTVAYRGDGVEVFHSPDESDVDHAKREST